MILANLTLSLLSGSGAFFLLINPGYSFSNAAYAFGILSVWQFYCECYAWHKKQNADNNSDNPTVFRFGRFSWRVSEACRHWLISGETGTGKTFFFRRVIWQLCSRAIIIDEYQKVATASEAGLSDYNTVDTLREAKIMFMAGTQSIESLTPPMGSQDKAKVFIANMANRVTFKAADEGSAKSAADTIGKHEVRRKSYGVSGGKRSSNKQKEDRYIIQPYKFRQLKKFQCVIRHCERGWQKLTLPPLELDGKICDWWKRRNR